MLAPVNGRLAAALRALRGRPAEEDPEVRSSVDPVGDAIAVLRETPRIEVQRRGFHFQECNFYSPVNDLEFLEENRDLWHGRGLPRGVNWDLEGQVEYLEGIASFARELVDVPNEMAPGPPSYHWRNDFWNGLDAIAQYAILRDARPRRVVEVGCGWSSLLMAEALLRNEAEGAGRTQVDQVEPYARKELLSALPDHWRLHESILQRAPLELFESLEAGDVCFYDGSHVARAGSDVAWFFFEILPRLAPGVLVHVHDIFWPNDYPDQWIFEGGLSWNEQYVFQAFLMGNREFRLTLANAAVADAFPDRLQAALGTVPTALTGGSVWMRREAVGDDGNRA